MIKYSCCRIAVLLITLCSCALAHAETTNVDPDFKAFIAGIEAELQSKGIDPSLFRRAFGPDMSPDRRAVTQMKNQPESKFTFAKYSASMVSPNRVATGRTQLAENRQTLNRISAKYGVPAGVIVALWGVESFYGKWPGKHHIVRSLATLAYDSHRQAFFRKELMAAMQILQEGHIAPEHMTGSWAGAMGQCQFMPSSFMAYAADGDGDGHKNIWEVDADVFASTANYLKKQGWKPGQAWGQRVVLGKFLPADLRFSERGLSHPMPLEKWQKEGVIAAHGGFKVPASTKARLFIPDGPSGKAYLVYPNFDVILDWNRSSYFAWSVLTLADAVAADKVAAQ